MWFAGLRGPSHLGGWLAGDAGAPAMIREISLEAIAATVDPPAAEVCAWDNGLIVVRLNGLEPVADAIAGAVRDHQATIAHQAARRGRGIVDVAPAPNRTPPARWALR